VNGFKKSINSISIFFAIASVFLLISCNGGGGGNGSNDQVKQGIFIDSPVQGVEFSTVSQSGITDSQGAFNFKQGETITFSLGGIVLGHATAKETMTPIDLVQGATDEMNPTVTNICRLLQSLDVDNNLDNGIQITQEIIDEIQGLDIDFNASSGFLALLPDYLIL